MPREALQLAFPRPRARSRRARDVASLFGLNARSGTKRRQARVERAIDQLLPAPGSITLLTGPSGSGKSSLLRLIASHARASRAVIDLDQLHIPTCPLVDCFPDIPLNGAIAMLNRVGLAEAWTYLRTPGQLSAGQQWRFRLALALHRARGSPALVVCDEFTSLLDRVTAMIVARSLRRSLVAPTCAIVATSHDDLVEALQPDMLIECDFGIATFSRAANAAGSATQTQTGPKSRG